ncbi:hypothetical protein DL95DRAFT_480829 [Leptodontidium sp. 2 PMI_412]|nr:hypothetical protein DL95DRAFT_480829 [Leptodontidium sp. 2 PMI_412]
MVSGPQSDVAAFFSRQWHAIPSAVQTGEELEELEEVAKKIEEAARPTNTAEPKESYVDAIIISHEFTDHMHQETLLSLPASISVIASPKVASIIRSYPRHILPLSLICRASRETSASPRYRNLTSRLD